MKRKYCLNILIYEEVQPLLTFYYFIFHIAPRASLFMNHYSSSELDESHEGSRVSGRVSEVYPFLKAINSSDQEPLRSMVQFRYYLRARTRHRVLSSLNCLFMMVVKAGIVTGDTL